MASTARQKEARVLGRAKACTECRQVKVACDAKEKFPGSCSRCVARQLDCRHDTNFKRVPTRDRLAKINSELEALKATVHRRRSTSLELDTRKESSGDDGEPTETTSLAIRESTDRTHQPLSSRHRLLQNDKEILDPKESFTLDSFTLQATELMIVFQSFEQLYYTHVPFIAPIQSLRVLYESRRLLFWTIVLTASRRHPTLGYLYFELLGPFDALLSPIFKSHVLSMEDHHAILIMCYWPITRGDSSKDPSWCISGFIMNAAMMSGLHRPLVTKRVYGSGDSFIAQQSIGTRVATWLACFTVSVRLSTWEGIPPHLSSPTQLQQITTLSRRTDIPSTIACEARTMAYLARCVSMLSGIEDQEIHMSLLEQYVADVNDVKVGLEEVWSTEAELSLLYAKLYLCAMSLLQVDDIPGNHNKPISTVTSKMLLQQGLTSAVELIRATTSLTSSRLHFDSTLGIGTPPLANPLPFPQYFITSLFFSVAFVFKYLSITSTTASTSDRELAVNCIISAHNFLNQYRDSRQEKQAVLLIEILGHIIHSGGGKPHLYNNSRLGASVVWDAIYTAREATASESSDPLNNSGHKSLMRKFEELGGLPPKPEDHPLYKTSSNSKDNTSTPPLNNSTGNPAFPSTGPPPSIVEDPNAVYPDTTLDPLSQMGPGPQGWNPATWTTAGILNTGSASAAEGMGGGVGGVGAFDENSFSFQNIVGWDDIMMPDLQEFWAG